MRRGAPCAELKSDRLHGAQATHATTPPASLAAAQAASFRALWDEFEANATPEARFAKSLDRFAPPVLNMAADGGSWSDYSVEWDTFETRVAPKITSGAPGLWQWLRPRARAVFDRLAGRA